MAGALDFEAPSLKNTPTSLRQSVCKHEERCDFVCLSTLPKFSLKPGHKVGQCEFNNFCLGSY